MDLFSTSDRSSADSSNLFLALSGISKGVLKDYQETFWKFSSNCDFSKHPRKCKIDNFQKIITFLKWKWTLFLLSYIQVLVMGDLGCKCQKNCTVETPWKIEAKMTLFGPFFISGRSSADPSKKLICFSDIPRGVLKHEQKKFWIWNFVRVRFAR